MSKEHKLFFKLVDLPGITYVDAPITLATRPSAGIYRLTSGDHERVYVTGGPGYNGFIEVGCNESGDVYCLCYGDDLGGLLRMKLETQVINRLLYTKGTKIKDIIAVFDKITGGAATRNKHIDKFDNLFESFFDYVEPPLYDVMTSDGLFRRVIFPTMLGDVSLTCYDDQVANPGIVIEYENEKLEQFVENFVLAGESVHKLLFKGEIATLVEEKYKTTVSYLESIAGEKK